MKNGPGEIKAFLRRTLGKGRGGGRVEQAKCRWKGKY
jgi:hypothetical protein